MKRLIILALFLCITLSACANTSVNVAEIYVNKEESAFCDFEVREGKVYIYCNIQIENDSEQEKEILLIGTFPDDYEHGLLKERSLVATTAENPEEIRLVVPPGGEYFLGVVFCGNHGGNMMKQHRLLPQLEIVEIVSQDASPRQ